MCKNNENGSSYCSNIVKILKNKQDCFARPADGRNGARNDGESVIQRTKSEESQNQEILRFAQDDERFSLAPMREREELLCEQSELSNSGEGYISCAKHTEKDLFSYLPIHLFTFRKAAFTLAEVLITLGIIGIVAALTLPTLIQNHKKQTYVNQLKKVVNTLENAAQMAVAQEGVSSFQDTNLYCKVFNPYRCIYVKGGLSNEAFATYQEVINNRYNLSKQYLEQYFKILEVNSSDGGYVLKFTLSDGSVIKSGIAGTLDIDINGNNAPNEDGRDRFSIKITDYGKLLPNDVYFTRILNDGWKMNY